MAYFTKLYGKKRQLMQRSVAHFVIVLLYYFVICTHAYTFGQRFHLIRAGLTPKYSSKHQKGDQ